jgi:hypothetical protein
VETVVMEFEAGTITEEDMAGLRVEIAEALNVEAEEVEIEAVWDGDGQVVEIKVRVREEGAAELVPQPGLGQARKVGAV